MAIMVVSNVGGTRRMTTRLKDISGHGLTLQGLVPPVDDKMRWYLKYVTAATAGPCGRQM